MAAGVMTGIMSVSLTIDDSSFEILEKHLFPGDHDEHGAILTIGTSVNQNHLRLFVRDVFCAEDGVDFVPGTVGYRELKPAFIARIAQYCSDQNLGYLAVHCHGGQDSVGFSEIDIASHERGYPALLQITRGGPVGALVFSRNAVAGDVWLSNKRLDLSYLTIVGKNSHRLYSSPQKSELSLDEKFSRHTVLFEHTKGNIFRKLKVGLIGAGGAGSIINQSLSRLGVGQIVTVDPQRIELANLPRVVGSRERDAWPFFTKSKFMLLQKLGQRLAKPKVEIARRAAVEADSKIQYTALMMDVANPEATKHLKDCDFLFLAADSMSARVIFNALVYQYLIPGIQVGVKIEHEANGHITNIFAVKRPVLPNNYGCLICHDLICFSALQEELLSPEERKAQRYIQNQSEFVPSVITLNSLPASSAVNDFMFMFTRLFSASAYLRHQLDFVQDQQVLFVEPNADFNCLVCGGSARSIKARGDRVSLPTRIK